MSARLETSALAGMAGGVATMLQPWWAGGMRTGFFLTLACTVLQIAAAHARKASP
jgi:hypothetical protein